MSFSFGTPLSSIPNTSYKNLTSPASYTGSTGSTGMDPGTALAISAGSSALSGGIGAAGSKKAADKASAAAEAQAKAVQSAAREAPFLGFGAESLAKKHGAFVGGPLDRVRDFEDAKLAGAIAFSPNTLAQERKRLAQELAVVRQQAYGKEMDPYSRFT